MMQSVKTLGESCLALALSVALCSPAFALAETAQVDEAVLAEAAVAEQAEPSEVESGQTAAADEAVVEETVAEEDAAVVDDGQQVAAEDETLAAATLAETVAAQVLPSVGTVYALVNSEEEVAVSQGSCTVFDEAGYLVTNFHVLEGYDQVNLEDVDYDGAVIQVSLNGEVYDAEFVGADPSSDVAVIKIDPGDNELVAMPFGDSSELNPGSWVMTVGSPYGERISVSQGIVSGTARSTVMSLDTTVAYYVGLIQSDAMMNSGSSGGALVNSKGEYVGMTTLSASTTGDFAGMSYAIPSNYIASIVEQIMTDGTVRHPLLGVIVTNGYEHYLAQLEAGEAEEDDPLLFGAYVESLAAGLGAETGGILPGDTIIALGGETIYSGEDLTIQVRSHAIGETVSVTVVRDGEEIELEVVLSGDDQLPATAEDEEEGTEFSSMLSGILGYAFGVDDEGEDDSDNAFAGILGIVGSSF